MEETNNIKIKVVVLNPGGNGVLETFKHTINSYLNINKSLGDKHIIIKDVESKNHYYPSNYTIITTL